MATATPEPDSKEPTAQPHPKPQPQPQPQPQPTSDHKPPNFYGYLINQDKGPTATLDALLRAIANHIVRAAVFSISDVVSPPRFALPFQTIADLPPPNPKDHRCR